MCFGHPAVGGDHLRVCGADDLIAANTITGDGSPPRVRSRLRVPRREDRQRRITSACAEQTSSLWRTCFSCWDHLRVCGADATRCCCATRTRGSPPRVRSRRKALPEDNLNVGITSACAEQTPLPFGPSMI